MKQTAFSSHFMRRISSLKTPSSEWTCLQCRHLALTSVFRPATSASILASKRQYARSANPSIPGNDPDSFTERLRRKIWKQDKPQDQADPYGDKSIIDRDKKKSQKAARSQEPAAASPVDDGYTPATNWDGLDRIGGPTGWWEEAWDEEHQFERFMAYPELESKGDISFAIYQALVEIYTLEKAALPLRISNKFLDGFYMEKSDGISFHKSNDGVVTLQLSDEKMHQEILDTIRENKPSSESSNAGSSGKPENTLLAKPINDSEKVFETVDKETTIHRNQDSISEEDQPPNDVVSQELDPITLTSENTSQLRTPYNTGWLDVSFDNFETKFAIFKRVMQLTGVRIPDHEIDNIRSARELLRYLAKKPKPKKLAENLMSDKRLTSLPNVQIMDRRYTPIDSEKEIGRWKLIEKELIRRDLPVTGNA